MAESLLTDRLASRLSFLIPTARAFDAIGPLCKSLKTSKTDAELLALVESVLSWAKDRNRALHEMAKLEEGELESWPDRYAKESAGGTRRETLAVGRR